MTIAAAYGPDKLGLSFELFPPKTDKGEQTLLEHVERLMAFRPSYVTCTYGAGGSTQSKTLEIVSRVRRDFGVAVATHLTCVGATADELRGYLGEAQAAGVQNVVALRGDPPQGAERFEQTAGGFAYANELVAMIRSDFPDLGVAVAGYPEVHQEAPSREADLENLKRKVDAGADAVITQLFYDNQDFFRFRDDCQRLGVDVPIVPGLLPITNTAQIKRITSLCGARLPADLVAKLEAAGDDDQAQFEAGVEIATAQTVELIEQGVPGIHYYVLNKSEAASRVLQSVNLPG
ncbi:5,10-methylenetetrahydrofolate reductase [Posidoniimonas polymericola]|uniref:Methylenetetrahydrofolate reductase n=1 Tax=Posidoniimonas polymericola TaxID=2528002 RepID=A0A5C5YS61_9BACT|nr:methylenetetrahydrofolate reductase [NAD(P)H] [Posidoniimonas polymericola]TWT77570.1 5,10-methylenetetrahydrofolate reductase [Posidoniimonas polymericola]